MATAPGARSATARPMSPLARASWTRAPATADRSVAMPPRSSGTPEDRQADLERRLEQVVGCGAGLVGLGGGRADHLLGELPDDVGEHLLVLARGQVEQAGVLRGGDPVAPGGLAGAGEGAPDVAGGAEPGAGHPVDGLLAGLADAEAVDQVAGGELVQGEHGEPDGVARLVVGETVAATGPEQAPRQLQGLALAGVRGHDTECNCELHAAPHFAHVSRLTHTIPLMSSSEATSSPGRDALPVSPTSAELPAGGTVRPVTRWGTEVMHRQARPVTSYDEELRSLVADMVATMYAADGVGLAACQIGVDLAVFVFDCPDDDGIIHRGVVCNPVVELPGGQGPQARRLRGGLPLLPGRVRRLRPSRPREGRRPGPRRGGRRLRGRRPVRPVPAARDRPHLGTVFGDRLNNRARKKLRKQMEAAAEDYPGQWPVGARRRARPGDGVGRRLGPTSSADSGADGFR